MDGRRRSSAELTASCGRKSRGSKGESKCDAAVMEAVAGGRCRLPEEARVLALRRGVRAGAAPPRLKVALAGGIVVFSCSSSVLLESARAYPPINQLLAARHANLRRFGKKWSAVDLSPPRPRPPAPGYQLETTRARCEIGAFALAPPTTTDQIPYGLRLFVVAHLERAALLAY